MSINGNASLTKGDYVWSFSDWGDEFKIEYDVIVNREFEGGYMEGPGLWTSLFHLTTGEYSGVGGRIPAVFLNPAKFFYTCYQVNGNDDYCKNYNYELNKDYHFEISQYKSNGEAIYSIKVNGETFHEIVNTTPLKYKDVKLYLSDPWYETFAPFGKLSNLKMIADLTKLSKFLNKYILRIFLYYLINNASRIGIFQKFLYCTIFRSSCEQPERLSYQSNPRMDY